MPAEELSPKAAMAKRPGMRFVRGEAKAPPKRNIENMANEYIVKAFWSVTRVVTDGVCCWLMNLGDSLGDQLSFTRSCHFPGLKPVHENGKCMSVMSKTHSTKSYLCKGERIYFLGWRHMWWWIEDFVTCTWAELIKKSFLVLKLAKILKACIIHCWPWDLSDMIINHIYHIWKQGACC